MTKNARLRELLKSEKILGIPGCYDAFSAKVIESMGFPVVYLTGYGTEASRLGYPDMGLTSMSEMADHAGNIAAAISVPLICDIDAGYGGLNNVMRTIREMERHGVSGVHMEDQTMPKKCPAAPGGISNISIEQMVEKVKAAVEARTDPDFLIIARSDTLATEGLDGVVKRLHAYLDAGADIVMVGERYTMEQYAVLGREFEGKMMICGGIDDWDDQNIDYAIFGDMGIKILIYSVAGIGAAGKAVYDIYKPLLETRCLTTEHLKEHLWGMDRINEVLNIQKFLEVESRMPN